MSNKLAKRNGGTAFKLAKAAGSNGLDVGIDAGSAGASRMIRTAATELGYRDPGLPVAIIAAVGTIVTRGKGVVGGACKATARAIATDAAVGAGGVIGSNLADALRERGWGSKKTEKAPTGETVDPNVSEGKRAPSASDTN